MTKGSLEANYGIYLIMSAVAYMILQDLIVQSEGGNSSLKEAIHSKFKEYISIIFYVLGIAVSFFYPYIAIGFYYVVALIWLIPHRRIEKSLKEN